MVWNNRIGWKKSQKLIKVWGVIIVLGGKFLECYFWPGEKVLKKLELKGQFYKNSQCLQNFPA